jgi:hypothetical protein
LCFKETIDYESGTDIVDTAKPPTRGKDDERMKQGGVASYRWMEINGEQLIPYYNLF